jgi:predicted ATP-dependent endonuclease of OLD family
MLQHLAVASTTTASSEVAKEGGETSTSVVYPNLVLAIEEPELYQHPNRQRHFARVLREVATGMIAGVVDVTQILFATHSPLFVGIDGVDQIRLLRKKDLATGKPRVTRVVRTTADRIAEVVWRADGEGGPKYTGATLIPRMKAIMTPWLSEGFFADVVVLVEGEDERSAILGAARHLGHDFEGMGISVIPCGGKRSLDRPAATFRELGIPTYLLWDSDKGGKDAKPEENHRLLRLIGEPVLDWPSAIRDTYACFEKKLEETLKEEIGPGDHDRWFAECQCELDIARSKDATKNPVLFEMLLKKAEAGGCSSGSLNEIVKRIVQLRRGPD